MSKFLGLVLTNLRRERPKVPGSLNFSVRTDRAQSNTLVSSEHATIYFRTRGCRFSNMACTMCDYWISDQVPAENMIAAVKEALDTLDFIPNEMLLNVSGSFFDDWEVSAIARTAIFEQLATRFATTKFIFEAHSHDITRERIEQCKSILKHNRVSVEMGLESADPWVLDHCVSKVLDRQRLQHAITTLKEFDCGAFVNIMVGTPFLNPAEMVADAVSTVNWSFARGVDKCVLFPMNTKPWTLVYWMEKQGLYIRPPLWALVDVLARLDAQQLSRVGIAWHRTRPQIHPKYTEPNQGPTTCPLCYEQVMALLDEYVLNINRPDVVKRLVDIQCICKDKWHAQVETPPSVPLLDRLKTTYATIGSQVLGEDWWSENGAHVLDQVGVPDVSWFKLA